MQGELGRSEKPERSGEGDEVGEIQKEQARKDPADHREGQDFILNEWSATEVF